MTSVDQAPIEPDRASRDDIDLRELAQVLLRRRWIIIAATLAALLVGVLVVLRSPRMYRARATVMIEQSAPEVLSGVRDVYDLGTTAFWAAKEYYETQYKVIASRPVAERTAARLGLAPRALAQQLESLGPSSLEASVTGDSLVDVPQDLRDKVELLGFSGAGERSTLIEALEEMDVAAAIQGLIIVDPVKDSRLVGIAVENVNPQRAATIANAVADAYIEYNLDQKVVATRSAVDWLSDQMRELKDRLQQSELALYQFKKDNGVVSVSMEERQTIIAETLSQLNRAASEARAKRLALESRRDQLKRARDRADGLEAIDEVISNRLVQELKANYSKLKQEEAEMAGKYTEHHPALQATRDKLAIVQGELRDEVNKIIASVDGDYEATTETERRLLRSIEEVKAEALDLNRKEIEFNRLKRERDNNQALYDLVLKREKEADLTQMLKVNNVSRLEAAQPPTIPIRPRVRMILSLALVLGLLFGVGLAFLIDFLDNSVKTQQQVEQRLGLPFLGIVPAIRGDKGMKLDRPSERDLFMIEHPRSSVAECCRTVRTNLLFATHERQARRLLFTSSGPQEGKTTTAINLAITMAQAGGRTLLVDTDMRRPRLHKSFGVGGEAGISSLILGEGKLDGAVRRTQVENLDLLPCGPLPPNPAELLHTESFKSIVEELSRRYDRIFFDSPPVSAVADALVLASMVDGVVLIIQEGRTSWQAALNAKRRLESVGGKMFGAVLNAVDLSRKQAGGGYQYYYYYHGGYGEETKRSA